MIEISMDKHLIGPWVTTRIGGTWGPEGREAIGLVRDDEEVLAGVMLENYTGHCITMHIAISSANVPIRKLLVTSALYVFNQLGCHKILGLVPSTNKAALSFDTRLGFTPEAIIKDVFKDGDMIVLSMTREQCGFLPKAKEAA